MAGSQAGRLTMENIQRFTEPTTPAKRLMRRIQIVCALPIYFTAWITTPVIYYRWVGLTYHPPSFLPRILLTIFSVCMSFGTTLFLLFIFMIPFLPFFVVLRSRVFIVRPGWEDLFRTIAWIIALFAMTLSMLHFKQFLRGMN